MCVCVCVNILGGSVRTIKKNAEASVAAGKENGLEANASKTKYMVMPRQRNEGRRHDIKIENSSFERVEEFKYLGTLLTNQNNIQEEIKSRLKSGNAIIRCRIFCLPLRFQKIQILRYTELLFCRSQLASFCDINDFLVLKFCVICNNFMSSEAYYSFSASSSY